MCFFYLPAPQLQRSLCSTLTQGQRGDVRVTAPSPGRYPRSALLGGAGMLGAGAAANCRERRHKLLPLSAQMWSVGKAGASDPPTEPPQCQKRCQPWLNIKMLTLRLLKQLASSTGASQRSGCRLPKILHPSIPPSSPRTGSCSGKGLSLPHCSTFLQQLLACYRALITSESVWTKLSRQGYTPPPP